MLVDEIVPVEIQGRRGKPPTIVDNDDALFKMDARKLRDLMPVFMDGGTITAGNASPISDGAAALVIAYCDFVLFLGFWGESFLSCEVWFGIVVSHDHKAIIIVIVEPTPRF